MAAAPSPLRGRTLARDLCALLGAGTASSDAAELKAVAGDQWTRLRMSARAGRALPLAEVVAWPRDVTEVSRIVGYAAERQIPIVPVGGRSGQSGACVAERGGIALSLSRLSGMPRVDLPSRVVDVEAGLLGARLADVLDAEGASLGHQPDDLSQATVGGWMATRSASEASSRAGAIEDLVLSLTAVDGTGQILRTIDGPSSGLDLVPLLLGSEGTLCVFTSAHLRIFPAAKARWTRALRFSSMERGLDAMRRLVRAGLRPSLCTLLDPLEALLEQRAARGSERLPMPLRWVVDLGSAEALRLALRAPWLLNSLVEALPAAPLLLLSFEATGPHAAQEAEDEGQEALRVASGAGTGGEDLGPGSLERLIERKEPLGGRRRALEQAGAFVDALDVATTWDKAPALLGALRRAAGTKALVTARAMSPALEGCAIDLNIVGLGGPTSEPASGVHEASEDLLEDLQKAEERHDAVIAQVLNAAADAGATLSHHRGVGLQRKLLLPREHGEGMRQLRALKKAFDPQGILNPGKLLL